MANKMQHSEKQDEKRARERVDCHDLFLVRDERSRSCEGAVEGAGSVARGVVSSRSKDWLARPESEMSVFRLPRRKRRHEKNNTTLLGRMMDITLQ